MTFLGLTMWHNPNSMPGSYPHAQQSQAKQASPDREADSWEDQFDSGALDARLQNMHVSPAHRNQPSQGRGQPGSYPQHGYQANHRQNQMFSQPPPTFVNGGGANGGGLLPTPPVPAPMVQGQIRIAQKPQNPEFVDQNRFNMPPPQILPRAAAPQLFGFMDNNSSQRLPPTALYQHQQKQMQEQQTLPAATAPQQPTSVSIAPRPQIMSRTVNESSCISEYKAPEPQLKILKRPSSSGTLSAKDNEKNSNQPKSLKQREEEYAQARLRILGSTGQEEEESVSPAPNLLTSGGAAKGSPVLVSKKAPQDTVRAPKGPDGSKGFGKRQ